MTATDGSGLQELDPLRIDLPGATAVEASAGTGKTTALTRLYLRLVAEGEARVDQILVVTYTNAATAELRDRVRASLARALRVAEADDRALAAIPETERDGFLLGLRACAGDPDRVRRRLDDALRGFDEAAIFTIHGFCQRVLAEAAFESAMPFESELVPDDDDMLREIVDDFWRRDLTDAKPPYLRFLLAQRQTPEKLAKMARTYVGKPDLERIASPETKDVDELEEEYLGIFDDAAGAWKAGRGKIRKLIDDATGDLNGKKYQKRFMTGRLEKIDDLFRSGLATTELPDQLAYFTTSTLSGARKNEALPAPRHAFFDLADDLVARVPRLKDAYARRFLAWRADMLEQCRARLDERKRALEVQSYDDLLLRLRAALRDPRSGGRLAERIRRRYPAALIDEFQDTDPVQFDIFRRVYGETGSPTVFVGDPKQAIYSFRGADIFAFLAAREKATRRRSLRRNWRSQPDLVTAVNRLFGAARDPFVFSAIEFDPVEPAPALAGRSPARLLVRGEAEPPLRVWLLKRDDGEDPVAKGIAKGVANDRAARATAAEIARLLDLGARGEATIDGRPIHGGDVAVLVPSHYQGSQVRDELLRVGVACVKHGMDSVYSAPEAAQLERVLLAVANPGDESLLRAALATEILGTGGEELLRLREGRAAAPHGDDPGPATPDAGPELAWEAHLERFQSYGTMWREHGFVRAFRQMLADYDVAARLLGYRDGERRLTNLLHLGELLQSASVRGRLGMEALLRWLSQHRLEPNIREEEQQLRLETDAKAVQVVTVHKSKGLEYGIVFCPFSWDSRSTEETDVEPDPDAGADPASGSAQPASGAAQPASGAGASEATPASSGLLGKIEEPLYFHDRNNADRATVHLGSPSADHRERARREELAEGVRLLYVALTRAKHRCTFVWGPVEKASTAPLAWLLHQPPGSSAAGAAPTILEVQKRFRALTDSDIEADLEALARASGGTIAVGSLPEDSGIPFSQPPAPAPALEARAMLRPVPSGWRTSSFSALVRHATADRAEPDAEGADYDPVPFTPLPTVQTPTEEGLFEFRAGRDAGRCLHEIFEQLDFSRLGSPPAGARSLEDLAAEKLRRHGFDGEVWKAPVAAMVRRVAETPLVAGEPFRLADLRPEGKLVELEFTYPVENLDPASLRRVLAAHRFAGGVFDDAIAQLSFHRVKGYMKGFIDLVFEADGRFHLLDYKSNLLGTTWDRYDDARLEAEIGRSGYFLQFLIYAVTLHRLLALRLPGYDPARHLGCAYYVFLRGVDGRPGHGVFRAVLDPPLVVALDRLIATAAGSDAERGGEGRAPGDREGDADGRPTEPSSRGGRR